MARVGDVTITQAKGLFGRFDDAVNGLHFTGLRHVQVVGNPEDRQRHQPLRRRRHIEDVALAVGQTKRYPAVSTMGRQILGGQWQSEGVHFRRHLIGECAAIKTVQPVGGEAG